MARGPHACTSWTSIKHIGCLLATAQGTTVQKFSKLCQITGFTSKLPKMYVATCGFLITKIMIMDYQSIMWYTGGVKYP